MSVAVYHIIYNHISVVVPSNSVLNYLQKKFPYTSTKDYPYKHDKKLKKKFSRASLLAIFVVLIYLFVWPPFYAAIFYVFTTAFYEVSLSTTEIYYAPHWLIYSVAGLFFTISTLIWLYEWTFMLYFQSDYEQFSDFYDNQQMYDNKKAGVWLAKIGFVLTLIVAPFTFTSKVILYNDGVTINQFVDVCSHTYPFSEVSHIVYYDKHENKNGVINDYQNYVYSFSDGYKFSAGFYFSDVSLSKKFSEELSKRSGKAIEYIQVKPYE